MTIKFENRVHVPAYILHSIEEFRKDINTMLDTFESVFVGEAPDIICVIIRERNDDGTFTEHAAVTTTKDIQELKIVEL